MSNYKEVQIRLAAGQIEQEAIRASGIFPKFNSGHEGWAVIKEELDELWEEVRTYPNEDPNRMAKEAIHVGAMALRFLADLCAIGEEALAGENDGTESARERKRK